MNPMVLCVQCGRAHRDPFDLGGLRSAVARANQMRCPCGHVLNIPGSYADPTGQISYHVAPGDAPLVIRAVREAALQAGSAETSDAAREVIQELADNSAAPQIVRHLAKCAVTALDSLAASGRVLTPKFIASVLTLILFSYCSSDENDKATIINNGIQIESIENLDIQIDDSDELRAWLEGQSGLEAGGEAGG